MSDALCREQQQQLVLSATSSSECFDLDSIIDEILSWLPAKSLLRFRCVSKSWRALISNPYFIRKHLNRINLKSSSSRSYSLLIKNDTFRTVEFEQLLKCLSHDEPLSCRSLEFPVIDPLFKVPNMEFIGSSNGLICLNLLLEWDITEDEPSFTFMIWNPCTRVYRVLPPPPLQSRTQDFLGFGYDSTTDDYKLVHGSFKSDHEFVVIFSLKSGSRRILEGLNRYYEVVSEVGCLVNETLHWVLDEWQDGEFTELNDSMMVSFDLAKEKFLEIPFPFLPNPVDRLDLVAEIGILNSCLTMCFQTMCGEVGSTLKMWVLKNYGVKESWTEVISIPSEAKHDEYNYMTCISENGEVLMQAARKGSLALYNPKEKKFRTLMDCGGHWYQWLETATYIETLVSPFIGSNGPSV